MKINCIAIDDEPLGLDIIKAYSEKISFLNLNKTFNNPVESIDFIKKNHVDLIFLDIQMDELTGFQLLNILKVKPLVIFTTAYDKYAVNAFDNDAIDYLLKPFSFERFLKAVNKSYDILFENNLDNKSLVSTTLESKNYIFLKTGTRLERVSFSEILYIEGLGDYLSVITNEKRIVTLLSFKKIENILPTSQFIRIHKSYIINIDKINSIEKNQVTIQNKKIQISETYKTPFFNMIQNKNL